MSPSNKFFTFFEYDDVSEAVWHFMGIEATSEVFDGVLSTFSNIDAIEKVCS